MCALTSARPPTIRINSSACTSADDDGDRKLNGNYPGLNEDATTEESYR